LLKSYREALAQYHLRPEAKFLNGNYMDRGLTERRRIEVSSIRNIGKEANHWEEQFYLGADEGEQIDYGLAPSDLTKSLAMLRSEITATGQRKVARGSGISRRTLSRLMQGKRIRNEIVLKIIGTLKSKRS
jgi:hypothetical protein